MVDQMQMAFSLKQRMKFYDILLIMCLTILSPMCVECQDDDNDIRYFGFIDGLFDGSISFMEKLKSKYKWYMNREDVSNNNPNNNVGDENEDRYLKVIGDGHTYDRVVVNKTYDGGLSYQSFWDFIPKNPVPTQRPFTILFDEVTKVENKYDDYDPITRPSPTRRPRRTKLPSKRPILTKPTEPKPEVETEEEEEHDDYNETEDPYSPDPMSTTTEMGEIVYPTDQDKSYPSGKDGVYGFVVQLSSGKTPRFARPRGKEVYYFNKIGKDFIFTTVMIPIKNNEKKLPPDITALFKGPDDLYYFIREDAYCRRPLNVSGVGLDPPDYCPEGGDLRELLGCNIRFYPPEVDDLCNNPTLDHSFLSPDKSDAYLIRGSDVWLLTNLPTNPQAAPSKCNMTKLGDATEIWKGFNPKADAFFIVEEDNKKHVLVQFYKHRFIVWNFKGGKPISQGFIKELPLNENQYNSRPLFTEKPEEAPIETVERPANNIVYSEPEFKELCKDPIIDSADSNLDGTLVVLFKDEDYYLLSDIKEKGQGKLIKYGKASELHPEFVKNSSAVMTCKEGRNRGYIYEFNTIFVTRNKNDGKPHTQFTSWDLDGEIMTTGEEWIEPSAAGFQAVFHNRNVTDPVMIALRDDEVFYYSTVAEMFSNKRRSVKNSESREKLPAGVTAAFSMPNQMIYLFREKHYCKRELYYNRQPAFCPEWRDSRELFGCFGDNSHSTEEKKEKRANDMQAMKDLCSDLNFDDLDRDWEREDMIYVWRKKKFWKIADFPDAPRVIEYGLSADKWDGFSDSPDAVVIIQEGKVRRGWFYAMYDQSWSSWYPDRKPWVGYKSWWGQPAGSVKFNAMLHNGNIRKPMVYGFDGSNVFLYSSSSTVLIHKGILQLEQSEENWPKDVTAAFRMEDNTVYLLRGNKYCRRKWKCDDKKTSCCKKWLPTKKLFRCGEADEYSFDKRVNEQGYLEEDDQDEMNTDDEELLSLTDEPDDDYDEDNGSDGENDVQQQTTTKKPKTTDRSFPEEEILDPDYEEPVTTSKPKKKRKKPYEIMPTPRRKG